jgi:hypothetical protein
MLDAIGWVATAIFSASYFFRQPAALRRIQAGAALLWVVYGLAIGALPVVVANVIVAAAAIYSSSSNRDKIDYTNRSLSNSQEKS